MGHLGHHEQMSLILPPFDYGHTVALSLDNIFFNQFQTMQFFLDYFDDQSFVLLSVKIQNGSSLIDLPFLQTKSQALKNILFIIEYLTSINNLPLFASETETLSICCTHPGDCY